MLYYIKLIVSFLKRHIDKDGFNAYNVSLEKVEKKCPQENCLMSLSSSPKKLINDNEFADAFAKEFPTEEDALRYIEQQADLFSPDSRVRKQKIHSLIHDVLFSKHTSSSSLITRNK